MTLFSLIIVLPVKLDYFNFNNKKNNLRNWAIPKIASKLINYRLPCSEDHQISCLLVA